MVSVYERLVLWLQRYRQMPRAIPREVGARGGDLPPHPCLILAFS